MERAMTEPSGATGAGSSPDANAASTVNANAASRMTSNSSVDDRRYRPVTLRIDGDPAGVALAGGIWEAEGGASEPPTVLAIHGITASHLSWQRIARLLPGARIVAPDLRGRAASAAAPPPWNMTDHADDAVRMLDANGVDRAVVVGHSMGGFVAAWTAARHPDRVSALVLVDGGLPLPWPEGLPKDEDAPARMLGPAGDRLSAVFPDRAASLAFWRAHPAFADAWTPEVERYVLYDLQEVDGGVRARTRLAPVATNIVQMTGDDGYAQALQTIDAPIDFLHAPRGLLDEVPPLYPDAVLRDGLALVPRARLHEVADVNHYTIVLGAGAARVATVIDHALRVSA
jgi:lipase